MTVKFAKPKPKENPTLGQQTFVRLPDELRERLDVLCVKEDRSLSSIIRILIVEALETRQKAKMNP